MTKYFLAFRPCVEIITVTSQQDSPFLVAKPPFPQVSLYQGAAETDLLSLASTLSMEAYQVAKEWNRSITQNRTSTLLLLLSTSGVIIYLLYKRKSSDSHSPGSFRPKTRKRRPRWRSRDWLWWLFGEDELLEDLHDDSIVIQGKCLGPPRLIGSVGEKGRRSLNPSSEGMHSERKVVPLKDSQVANSPASCAFILAPCPNCVLGACRIKKHQIHENNATSSSSSSFSNSPFHAQSNLPPTSTPESADDEASDVDDGAKAYSVRAEKFRSRFFRPELDVRFKGDGSDNGSLTSSSHKKVPRLGVPAIRHPQHRSSAKLYSSHNRIPPIGQEHELSADAPKCGDFNCSDPICLGVIKRDESIESIINVSGSMMDLVKGAREIRRLIREASFDSIASEFSLDLPLNDHFGGSTECTFDSIQRELSELKQNCSAMDDKMDRIIPFSGPSSMVSSKSEYGLSTSPSSSYCDSRRSRTPDPLLMQKSRKHFWKMTNYSDLESPLHSGSYNTNEESLEWDSPFHGWHDLRQTKYKIALSSHSASECGDEPFNIQDDLDDWEWDSEGFSPEDWREMTPTSMMHHKKWLPEHAERFELDLEAELSSQFCNTGSARSSANSSRAGSRRDSLDKNFFMNRVRLPPSGRSSVDHGSGDTPKQSIDRAALIKSFGVYVDKKRQPPDCLTKSGCSSDESGFQEGGGLDTSGTSSTMFISSVLTLSPVHEAKEPSGSAQATPVKSAENCNTATPSRKADVEKCNRVLFQANDEDRLIVVINRD